MRISDWSSDVCSSDVWWHRVVDHYRKPENRLGLGTGKLFEKGIRLAKCLFGGVGQVIMRVPSSYFAKFPRKLSRVSCGVRACLSLVPPPLHLLLTFVVTRVLSEREDVGVEKR